MNTDWWQNIKSFFRQKSALPQLMFINIAVFLLTFVAGIFMWLMNSGSVELINNWLAAPADVQKLALRPWTLVSYMFLHNRLGHLFFNMLALYFGGMIFTQYLSDKKLLWTYLLGGLFGALLYVLAFNVFPVFEEVRSYSYVLGASASVLAIIVASATYMPTYRINLWMFGSVQLKYLAIIFVGVDFLSITGGNAGGHIAHLGGALYGFVYVQLMNKNIDLGKLFGRRPKMKVERNASRPLTDDEYNRRRTSEQARVDAILDKIAKNGYSSLTKEEKDFLFTSSKK